MKTASTQNPNTTESNPFWIFSLPSDGPTVRSSTISIGAASAPARIRSEMSFAPRLVQRARLIVDHADFERRRTPENILGARGVLHARQLHDDAIAALLLNDRLRDAELVDAVAQNRDVLLDGAVLNALLCLGFESCNQAKLAAWCILLAYQKVGKRRLDCYPCLIALRLVFDAEP